MSASRGDADIIVLGTSDTPMAELAALLVLIDYRSPFKPIADELLAKDQADGEVSSRDSVDRRP